MKKNILKTKLLVVLSLWGFHLNTGCTSTMKGSYSDPMKAEIVDDRWNETDARTTAEKLVGSMLSKPWLGNFKAANSDSKPVVVISDMENRTDEHIDTEALGEAIRNEVINSNMVRFVDAKGRSNILKEIQYQTESGMVSASTAKQKGKQIGADFMVTGAISSQVHQQGGLKTVTYQTVLQLTSFETAEIVWSEKHKIKKRFNRSALGL